MDSAFRFGRKGWGFESLRRHQKFDSDEVAGKFVALGTRKAQARCGRAGVAQKISRFLCVTESRATHQNMTFPITVTLLSTKSEEHKEEDEKIVEKTCEYAENAVKTMSEFYKITLTMDIQLFIGDRGDLDSLSGRKTEEWAVGVNGRSRSELVLLDPRLYKNTASKYSNTPETNHNYTDEDHQKLLDHEIGHIYFDTLLDSDKNNGGPLLWLNEGCQYFAAGQCADNPASYETFNANILTDDKRNFYGNSGVAVARFVEVFGQDDFVEKLTVILNSVGNAYRQKEADPSVKPQEVFENTFEENFGFKLDKENLETFVKTGQIPMIK